MILLAVLSLCNIAAEINWRRVIVFPTYCSVTGEYATISDSFIVTVLFNASGEFCCNNNPLVMALKVDA